MCFRVGPWQNHTRADLQGGELSNLDVLVLEEAEMWIKQEPGEAGKSNRCWKSKEYQKTSLTRELNKDPSH